MLTAATRLDLPTRSGRTARHALPPTSESLGVHRGRVHYAADVSSTEALVIEGASDIVDLALDGRALPTIARFGATELIPTGGATRLDATVETWGHANFDDARLPALRLGSLRGIGRVWSVVAQEDVSGMWTVDGPEQWAGHPAPLPVLGGWSSTRVGVPVTYRRRLAVDGIHHHALRFGIVPGTISVDIDGRTHIVSADDPWLHLAPGEGRRHRRDLRRTSRTLSRVRPSSAWRRCADGMSSRSPTPRCWRSPGRTRRAPRRAFRCGFSPARRRGSTSRSPTAGCRSASRARTCE